MTVMVYKMVSGEEVIAKLENFENGIHTVQRARVLRMMQTQQGPSFALVPWIISLMDEEVSFPDTHVMVWKDCPSDIEKSYLEQTSGIQISQSLLG